MTEARRMRRLIATRQPIHPSAPTDPYAFVTRLVLFAVILGIGAETLYLNRSPCSCACSTTVGEP